MDDFIKRILQLEEIISLQLTIERAKAIKLIQGKRKEGKERKSKSRYFGRRFKEGGGKKRKKEEEKREEKKKNKANFKENLRECWLCETVKHFRYECLRKEENSGKFVN